MRPMGWMLMAALALSGGRALAADAGPFARAHDDAPYDGAVAAEAVAAQGSDPAYDDSRMEPRAGTDAPGAAPREQGSYDDARMEPAQN